MQSRRLSSKRFFLDLLTVFSVSPDRTERTFVKQLQELIEIYIQPSSLPVGGITNKGETIVPVQERKIVFNGLESLYSFHKQIFLPALEKQAEPLLSRKTLSEVDGETSTKIARDVAEVFVNHAAFMKMYSTYIKSVYWIYSSSS